LEQLYTKFIINQSIKLSILIMRNTKSMNFSIIAPLFVMLSFFIILTFNIDTCDNCLEFVFAQTFTEPINLTDGSFFEDYVHSHIDYLEKMIYFSK
jgi:hypothetical protein